MKASVFSQRQFASAMAASHGGPAAVLPIHVIGSGPDRTMYAVRALSRNGLGRILLAPYGLYASPGWQESVRIPTVRGILKQLKDRNNLYFEWTVRFDDKALKETLKNLDIKFAKRITQVLGLHLDYERVFAEFNATTRNQIRRSWREGVRVTEAKDAESVSGFYRIYKSLQESKHRRFMHSEATFRELLSVDAATILVAKLDSRIIGGGIFIKDETSTYYWQGAYDRQFANYFPSHAILDQAIKAASEAGIKEFDFGSSAGSSSVEKFKSFWGARSEEYWSFQWQNPVWKTLLSIQSKAKRVMRLSRRLSTFKTS